MENKIYIVKCSTGNYDDFTWWIAGVYDTIEGATILMNELNTKAKRIQESSPVPKDPEGDYYDSEEYWEYYAEHAQWMDWNEAGIAVYTVNKPTED